MPLHAASSTEVLLQMFFLSLNIKTLSWKLQGSVQTSHLNQGYLVLSLSLFKSLLNLLQYCLLYALAFWLLGIEDLSLLTRDQTCSPCIGRQSLIHWIMREVPLVLLVFFIKSTSLHTFIGEMWGTKRGGERKYLVAVILSLSKARGFSHFTPFLGISLFMEILDLCFPIWIVTNHICLLHTQMWLIWSEKYYNWNISQVLKIV